MKKLMIGLLAAIGISLSCGAFAFAINNQTNLNFLVTGHDYKKDVVYPQSCVPGWPLNDPITLTVQAEKYVDGTSWDPAGWQTYGSPQSQQVPAHQMLCINPAGNESFSLSIGNCPSC